MQKVYDALVVGTGIAGCSAVNALCNDGNIFSELLQAVGCVVAGRTRANYDTIETMYVHYNLLMWNPPSTLIACPVT